MLRQIGTDAAAGSALLVQLAFETSVWNRTSSEANIIYQILEYGSKVFYAEIKHSDWLKIVLRLATFNQGALFSHSVRYAKFV